MRIFIAWSFGVLLAAPPIWADPVAWLRYEEASGTARSQSSAAQITAETPFAIASVGKTMTAVAVLRVADRQGVSLQTPLASLVPPIFLAAMPDLAGVSLAQALSMTSGLPDYLDEGFEFPAPPSDAALAAVRYASAYPAEFRPGADFDYSNTNYVLLGAVLETLTGRPYADAMAREVFAPTGMSGAFVFGGQALPRDFPNGHEGRRHVRAYYQQPGLGDGGVIASASDVAAFYRALFLERRLLPETLLRAMLRDPVGAGYGFGIDLDPPIYGHSGGDLGFSSDVRINLETGVIAIELRAEADAEIDWTWDQVE